MQKKKQVLTTVSRSYNREVCMPLLACLLICLFLIFFFFFKLFQLAVPCVLNADRCFFLAQFLVSIPHKTRLKF